jgi:type IV pilus assembly protein PilO
MAFDLSDQKNQLMLLGIMGGLGLIYVWFTYLYEPRGARITELDGQVQTLTSEIGTLRIEVAQLPKVQAQHTELTARWDELLTAFPSEPFEEEVLGNVTSAQTTAGLFITGFNKGESRRRELFTEQDYTVNLVGRYHELGVFIAQIAAKPRRMSIERMRLTHPSQREGGGGSGGAGPQAREDELYIVITLRTFMVPRQGG